MKTQTKCTLTMLGMLIIEILPVPLTSIYCLYTIRKRSDWLQGAVERLYADNENKQNIAITDPHSAGHDPMVTRKRCTVSLSVMIMLDFLIPFTILFGLYIVRRRPVWFKRVINRLYSDRLSKNESLSDSLETSSNTIDSAALEKKYIELHKSNIDFAFALSSKTK